MLLPDWWPRRHDTVMYICLHTYAAFSTMFVRSYLRVWIQAYVSSIAATLSTDNKKTIFSQSIYFKYKMTSLV